MMQDYVRGLPEPVARMNSWVRREAPCGRVELGNRAPRGAGLRHAESSAELGESPELLIGDKESTTCLDRQEQG
jgi:hypothetical protein